MTRPKSRCKIRICFRFKNFTPVGVASCDLQKIEISAEEAEALRLKNIKGYDQTAGAKAMGISQSTFQRILTSANKKLTQALFDGKAIVIREANS